jgi:hypothetical protein
MTNLQRFDSISPFPSGMAPEKTAEAKQRLLIHKFERKVGYLNA